jgi:hypothetical protein
MRHLSVGQQIIRSTSRIVGNPDASLEQPFGGLLPVSRPVFTNAFLSSCRIMPYPLSCLNASRGLGRKKALPTIRTSEGWSLGTVVRR